MATIGVKIELEGAPQYTENMSKATAQTKLYQAQVKRLAAEMGSGVSAFKKSITESKALQQQLDAQRNQSKLLEEQIAKTTEKYGEDSTQVIRLKTQYENLQAAIAKTTSELESNGGVAGAIGAEFQEIGSKVTAAGDKIAGLGDTLTTKLTAPIVALGAASVKAFGEVDAGLDTIIAKTGATGDDLAELEGIANNIATSIPASFDEVGNAVGEVNTRFGVTGDELETLSTQFIEFAKLNGTDVSSSVDNVQAAMAAFGLDASKASEVLDIMNKAGQNTGISMDSLSSSLLANATSLQEMGFDINSAAGFISTLDKNGIDASAAMSGLKKAFTNATSEGKTMDQALSELQDQMLNASSDTEAYQAALELFGNKAGPAIAKAVQEGRLSFDEASNSIAGFGDSVTNTFDATLDPIDQFDTNMNKIKLLGADFVNSAAPMIAKIMEKIAAAIEKATEAWNGLSEEQQENIIKIAGIVAAVGPVLSIVGRGISLIGGVISHIGTIISIIPTIISVVTTIGGVLMGTVLPAIGGVIAALAPFLPIIAAVAAAIAAIILIVKNWGTITDWLTEKWQIFTEWLNGIVENITQFFRDHFGVLGDIFATRIENIKIIIETYINIIKVIIETIMEVIKAIFSGDWDQIGEILRNAWEKIKGILANGINRVVTNIAQLGLRIKSKFNEIKNAALQWGKDMIQNFIDGLKAKWESLKQTVSDIAGSIKDFLGFSVPKLGPLHKMPEWPKHFMQQYADGIEASKYLVKDAINDVAQDVTILANPMDLDAIYEAVKAGASDANLSLAIGEREFTRSMRGMGVAFNG